MRFNPILLAFTCLGASSFAQQGVTGAGGPYNPVFTVMEQDDGTILAADRDGTYSSRTWAEYFASPFFKKHNLRCGKGARPKRSGAFLRAVAVGQFART
ncbi:MAG: hypothetical protein O2816_09410 [Planctomycetota bacterium]|nr:hypothetical protein [Planctomycetota bacterium]